MSPGADRRRGIVDDLPGDIDALIEEWARFERSGGTHLPVGGTISILAAMIEAKRLGIFSRGTNFTEPEMPANVALVDAAIAILERPERKAFRQFYLVYASAEDKARRCRCDVSTFYRRVRRARRIVGDFVQTRQKGAC